STEELQKFLGQSIVTRERLASALQESGTFYGGGAPPPSFLEKSPSGMGATLGSGPSAASPQADKSAITPTGGPGYSTTNVQVANVDEPDFLKNDGKYVYILSGDKITILDAYPAENASIIIKAGI
ncbi:MAG: copper amine oxidase, partial [Thaumarchaeota archaeon]